METDVNALEDSTLNSTSFSLNTTLKCLGTRILLTVLQQQEIYLSIHQDGVKSTLAQNHYSTSVDTVSLIVHNIQLSKVQQTLSTVELVNAQKMKNLSKMMVQNSQEDVNVSAKLLNGDYQITPVQELVIES